MHCPLILPFICSYMWDLTSKTHIWCISINLGIIIHTISLSLLFVSTLLLILKVLVLTFTPRFGMLLKPFVTIFLRL